MSQNTRVLASNTRYTRCDFAALRAWLNRIEVARIRDLYYDEDTRDELGISTVAGLRDRLERMRDELIHRASDINPHAADALQRARQSHSWPRALSDFLVQSAETSASRPKRTDPISYWFRPRVCEVFRDDDIRTIDELINTIKLRGYYWWKPIGRIGEGKAAEIIRWLRLYESSLGSLSGSALTKPSIAKQRDLVGIGPRAQGWPLVFAPLENLMIPGELDGSTGINRNRHLCMANCRNDLDAVETYLLKKRDSEKTLRSYRKELERFVWWCISERGVPLSGVLQHDCEAYKDFLKNIPPEWIGTRRLRNHPDYRPFAGQLDIKSQYYAVQQVQAFYTYLVDIRYLVGNPWANVDMPRKPKEKTPIQIGKALSADLWGKLTQANTGILDVLCNTPSPALSKLFALRGIASKADVAAQMRIVRAAILLIGDSGIRREEACYASRDKLKSERTEDGVVWELDVLGKGLKWRTVYLPERTIEAIKAHWADRRQDFTFSLAEIPLISPLTVPQTNASMTKHVSDAAAGTLREVGYSVRGLYRLLNATMARIAKLESVDLAPDERLRLSTLGVHALRHTFGTQAVAEGVPLDVVQNVLGHESLKTTTLYVKSEQIRSRSEMGKLFRKAK